MEFLKVKTLMPKDGTAIKVEVLKKAGEPVKDNYGNLKTPYDVKVNDKDLMRWDATENQVSNMRECGCNPFVIKRWDKDGKTGFNFLSPDDLLAQPQNCEPNISSAQIEKKVQDNKDEFQDKVSRGAAWNNAWTYAMAMNAQEGISLDKLCKEIAEYADIISTYQKEFVNKTESAPETPA